MSKSPSTGTCQSERKDSLCRSRLVIRPSQSNQRKTTTNGAAASSARPSRRAKPAGRTKARSRSERWSGIVTAKNASAEAVRANIIEPPQSSEPWKKSSRSGRPKTSAGSTAASGVVRKVSTISHGRIIHGPVSTSRTRSARESFARSLSLPARKRSRAALLGAAFRRAGCGRVSRLSRSSLFVLSFILLSSCRLVVLRGCCRNLVIPVGAIRCALRRTRMSCNRRRHTTAGHCRDV